MNAALPSRRYFFHALRKEGRWLRFVMFLGLTATLWAGCGYQGEPASTRNGLIGLSPPTSHRWSMEPEESRVLELHLEEGVFLKVNAIEKGVDIELRLLDPLGQILAQADSLTSGYGNEELVAITERGGWYRLELAAFPGPGPGGEVLLTTAPTQPTEQLHHVWMEALQDYQKLHENFLDRRFDATVEGAVELLNVWLKLGHVPQQIETLRLLGRAYMAIEEHTEAERSFHQALVLAYSVGDAYRVANILSFLGQARVQLGKVPSGIEDTASSVASFADLSLHRETALTLLQLGSSQQVRGDFVSALKSFEESLSILDDPSLERSYFITDHERARAYESFGALLLALNRLGDAQYQFERAETLVRRSGQGVVRQAEILKRLAYVVYRIGDFEQAEQKALESIVLLERDAGTPDGQKLLASLYLLKGRVELAQLLEQRSVVSFRRALELARSQGHLPTQGKAHLELGRALTSLGEPTLGLLELATAKEIFGSLHDSSSEAIASLRIAEILLAAGRVEEAWEQAKPALAMAEAQRVISAQLDDRADYFALRQEFFNVAIEILLALHKRYPDAGFHLEALRVHDLRRARSLLDVLNQSNDVDSGEESSPTVAKSYEVFPEALPWDGLTRTLGSDRTLVLVYCLLEETSHLWALADGQIRYVSLEASGPKIDAWADQFATNLAQRTEGSDERRRSAARRLSEFLLGPIEQLLKDQQRLVIVGTGKLQLIPFGALPRPQSDDADYLVRHHEVVALPSLSSWARLRSREAERPSPTREGLILGDPVFRPHDSRLGESAKATGSLNSQNDSGEDLQVKRLRSLVETLGARGLPRLPATGREVESVSRWLGADLVEAHVGLAAHRRAFFRPDLVEFRILHLATHAFQDVAFPEQSSLVLSLVDGSGNPEHGWIRAFEIAQTDLRAELVVLSGCETARGKQQAGEGILGLTRAFLEAGAPRVVSSLWKVEDQATANLMNYFYQGYVEGDQSAPGALRMAQRRMLQEPEFKDPFYWASFVFQGDWKRPERREQI